MVTSRTWCMTISRKLLHKCTHSKKDTMHTGGKWLLDNHAGEWSTAETGGIHCIVDESWWLYNGSHCPRTSASGELVSDGIGTPCSVLGVEYPEELNNSAHASLTAIFRKIGLAGFLFDASGFVVHNFFHGLTPFLTNFFIHWFEREELTSTIASFLSSTTVWLWLIH